MIFTEDSVIVGGTYRHYKGNLYRVLSIGRSSEDLSLQVVYQGLYNCPDFGDQPIWTRPLEMFCETVESSGESVPRFTLIEKPTHGTL